MSDPEVLEAELVRFAINKTTQASFISRLQNSKTRSRALDRLNHVPALDPEKTEWFPTWQKALNSVQISPQHVVFVLSASHEIDRKSMTFSEAVEAVCQHGWGTLLRIDPSMALYYGEEGRPAAVIRARRGHGQR